MNVPANVASVVPRQPISSWKSMALAAMMPIVIIIAWSTEPGLNWVLALGVLVIFMMFVGYALTGRLFGVLINERKLMSLSRLQMAIWTVLIVSAYLVIAVMRVRRDIVDPLMITIDWQIWTLLGISTASLVGTPLINDNKRNKQPGNASKSAADVVADAGKAFGESPQAVEQNRDGVLYGNASIDDARFTDIFEGDELGNTRFVEMAQVQMFLFTVIVALVYGVQLFNLIADPGFLVPKAGAADPHVLVTSLPLLPEGLLALMGVSHAGYLGNKAISRTPSSP